MIENVRTWTWSRQEHGLQPTLPGWEDEDTEVEFVPAGALAPRETLPPLDPVPGVPGAWWR